MSYFDRIQTEFVDDSLDSSGRLRTGEIETVLEGKFLLDKQPQLVSESISGAASSTFLTDSSIDMEVGNTIGDRIVRQSKNYAVYQPGKGQRVLATGHLNSNPTSGIRSRIGYFDDKADKSTGLLRGNGLFFQLDGTTLSVVLRSTSSDGTLTQTDTVIDQSSWNLDRLDGSGGSNNPSGITIDVTKMQIFTIDFLWLGTGRVRFGVIIGGKPIYCHEILNSNVNTTTYMNTPSLPVRYEIENTGGVTNSSVLKQVCYTVASEGGRKSLDPIRSVDMGINILGAGTTLLPGISIRLQPNSRSSLEVIEAIATNLSGNRNIRYGLYYNATLTGASWTNIVNSSEAQVDTSATDINITNASLLSSGYVISDSSSTSSVENQIKINTDIAGTSDIITLAFQTTNLSGDVIGGIKFKEIY